MDEELQKMVQTEGTKSIMYIMYHNDSTRIPEKAAFNFAMGSENWIKPAFIHKSCFFESLVYSKFLSTHELEWKRMDYVILGTYKISLTLENLSTVKRNLMIAANHTGLPSGKPIDVIPFVRGSQLLLPHARDWHGDNFRPTWFSLLSKMNYTTQDIEKYSNVRPFFRNVFVIKPLILKKLMTFMQQAILIAKNDREIKLRLKSDAHYTNAVQKVALDNFNTTYYQLHPFIFERLPSFFLRSIEANVCQHEGWKGEPCPANC
jgi:hypothetical protein